MGEVDGKAGESEGWEGVERGGGLLLVVDEESPFVQCIVSPRKRERVGERAGCVSCSESVNRRGCRSDSVASWVTRHLLPPSQV